MAFGASATDSDQRAVMHPLGITYLLPAERRRGLAVLVTAKAVRFLAPRATIVNRILPES